VNGFVGLAFVAVLLLPVMAMTVKNVTSTRRGNLALAAAFLAGAVILGAIAASRLEAISRLREHGLTANATTTNVDENFVSLPDTPDGPRQSRCPSPTRQAVGSARSTPTTPVELRSSTGTASSHRWASRRPPDIISVSTPPEN
jgi:hypothetical protein